MKHLRSFRKLCSLRVVMAGFAMLVAVDLAPILPTDTAEARGFRGGGGAARGGYRTSAQTTVRPGAGVTHSQTTVGGRYYRPATLPARAYVPGSAAGVVHRTARRTARRVAYRTTTGYSYYYGYPAASLPSPACYTVMWNGMTAYNCNGGIYIYEGGQYYPIEG